MVEAGGETTLEAEEEFLQEEDKAEVLQMYVAEEIIRTQVSQVARGLINKKSNVIIVRSLVIMHMNAWRNNMTKKGKAVDQHQHFDKCNVNGIEISTWMQCCSRKSTWHMVL